MFLFEFYLTELYEFSAEFEILINLFIYSCPILTAYSLNLILLRWDVFMVPRLVRIPKFNILY